MSKAMKIKNLTGKQRRLETFIKNNNGINRCKVCQESKVQLLTSKTGGYLCKFCYRNKVMEGVE